MELRYAMVIDSVTGPITTQALRTCVDSKESNRGMKAWVTSLSRGLVEVREASNEATFPDYSYTLSRTESQTKIESPGRIGSPVRIESPTRSQSPAQFESSVFDLVEIDQSRTFHVATEDQLASWIVQPNHQSVQDFIQDRDLFQLDRTNDDAVGAANWSILTSCLRYLAAEEVLEPFIDKRSFADREYWWRVHDYKLSKLSPFDHYALSNWPAHAIKVKDSESETLLSKLVGVTDWPADRILSGPLDPTNDVGSAPRTCPLLHLAAHCRLYSTVNTIFRHPSSPDPDVWEPMYKRTALLCATQQGHQDIVQLLLNTDRADANYSAPMLDPEKSLHPSMSNSLMSG